jgi:CDP-glucose 4,6-dehydratase
MAKRLARRQRPIPRHHRRTGDRKLDCKRSCWKIELIPEAVPCKNASVFVDAYREKTVWVSGHTGFKGGWLAHWLLELGAEVFGFSLEPPTQPALFDQLELGQRLHHTIADVRDANAVRNSIVETQPDFVFHMAAQPLVRTSYEQPVETYATNVTGTIHVLEALRALKKKCAAVLITSDKCYENREWVYGYREDDSLGGHDPYSSSKAAAEIAISAWRRSFFSNHPVRISSARSGNVIGGGDWAKDRIVPDCIRALQNGQPILVRNPSATRLWQHVLEPLCGYLWLAALLSNPQPGKTGLQFLTSAFNFGPSGENRTVAELVTEILKHWPGRWEKRSEAYAVHEAMLLQLSMDKAKAMLGWSPVWNFSVAVEQTVNWYRNARNESNPAMIRQLTSRQIAAYREAAKLVHQPWAVT